MKSYYYCVCACAQCMSGGAYHGMRGDQVKLSSNRFFYFFLNVGFPGLHGKHLYPLSLPSGLR